MEKWNKKIDKSMREQELRARIQRPVKSREESKQRNSRISDASGILNGTILKE